MRRYLDPQIAAWTVLLCAFSIVATAMIIGIVEIALGV